MEIERKFVVPENFKERLEEHGFGLVKEFEEVLQDKYYDTNEHHLLHMVKHDGAVVNLGSISPTFYERKSCS